MAVTDRMGEVVLYIARHAEVQNDKDGLIRGLLNDPLDSKGEKQAEELADLLEPREIYAAYTDDLKRTQQTLEAVALRKGLKMKIDPALRSWDLGPDLEGRSIEANREQVRRLKSQPHLIPVGGQSWGSFIKQTNRFFERYYAMGLERGPVLLIIHGSGIQVIWHIVGAMEMGLAYDETPLEPSGLAAIYQSRSGPKLKVLRGGRPNKDE